MKPLKLALVTVALGSVIGLQAGSYSMPADDKNSMRVYVTNSKDDEVTVIDAATMKIVGSIKTGANPHGIVASPDRRTLYVSVEGTDELAAVDAGTNQVKWRAKVGRAPNEVSITPDGRKVFVPIRNEAAVDVVDTAAMKVIDRMKAPAWPHNTYVCADGKHLYLGTMAGSRITIYDTATHKQLNEIAPGNWVRPIALRRDETLAYVALSALHGFAVVDLKQGKTIRRVELPPLPEGTEWPPYQTLTHGLALTPDERELYVTSMAGKAVYAFSVPELRQIAKIDVGRYPNWISISPDGRQVWVSNQLDDTVSAIDTRTKRVIATIPVGHEPKRLLVVEVAQATETGSRAENKMTATDNRDYYAPFACNLNAFSSAEREHYTQLTRELREAVNEISELPTGYGFRLEGGQRARALASEWVSFEKRCCPFFSFQIEGGEKGAPVWLRITGREGVKEFMRSEFGIK